MATPLNAQTRAELEAFVLDNDRIGYYERLMELGYKYGELALGVVTSETLSGRAANSFFLREADKQGIHVSSGQYADISLSLMKLDFAARVNSGGELSVDTIWAYHESAFESGAGVKIGAWTPAFALAALPTELERQEYWDALLSASNPYTAVEALTAPTEGDSSAEAIRYRIEIFKAGFSASVTGSNSYGEYNIDLDNGGGQLIGGGVSILPLPLTGGAGNDVIYGFDGIDILYGLGGDDVLRGGKGADLLYGGSGSDKLYGETGSDILYGGDNADSLYGGNGSDRLYGGDGADTLYGGNGSDRLYGDARADTLYGGDGWDSIYGGTGADILYGGEGNDTLRGIVKLLAPSHNWGQRSAFTTPLAHT